VAPPNQAGLKLKSVVGYNGNGRGNMIWHSDTGRSVCPILPHTVKLLMYNVQCCVYLYFLLNLITSVAGRNWFLPGKSVVALIAEVGQFL
jgi:hypothetical protein